MRKKLLRAEFLGKRKSLSAEERTAADRAIRTQIEGLEEFANASVVAGYATDGTEPDVLPLLRSALRRGAKACLPKWNGKEYVMSLVDDRDIDGLAPGKWGLPEPETTVELVLETAEPGILILTPGVAFDSSFARLGRGGGIYDRFLQKSRGRATALGVFYECQLCPELPAMRHDQKLDIVVTERMVRRRR